MDCAHIQRHLSEYLDGVLDPKTEVLFKRHLSHCTECQKELDAMKILVQDLGSLETFKAPDDFLEQLHHRMDQRLGLWKFIKGLFNLFRINIPLQLVTAAAMAVLIFAIVYSPDIKKEWPSRPVDKISEERDWRERPADGQSALAPVGKGREVKEFRVQSSDVHEDEPEKNTFQVDKETSQEKRAESYIEESKPKLKKSIQVQDPIKVPDKGGSQLPGIRETQIVAIAFHLKKSESIKGRGQSLKIAKQDRLATEKEEDGGMRAESAVKQGRTGLRDREEIDYPVNDPVNQDTVIKDTGYRDNENRRVLSSYEALEHIEDLITDVNGTILNIEYKQKAAIPEYIDAEIPGNRYSYFFKQLNKIGTVQILTPATGLKEGFPIHIQIQLSLTD